MTHKLIKSRVKDYKIITETQSSYETMNALYFQIKKYVSAMYLSMYQKIFEIFEVEFVQIIELHATCLIMTRPKM